MSLISQSIANLFNGVSQQPASLRHPSQSQLQENAYPSIASGLRKRNPTRHLAKLSDSPADGAFIHVINRDATERYVVVVKSGDIAVYDLDGVARTVSYPEGTSYLTAATPAEDFSLVTVADYTFVVNKTVIPAMLPATASVNPVNVAYVYVVSAPAQHTFNIAVTGFTSTVVQGTSGGTQTSLANALVADFNALAGFTAQYSASVVSSCCVKLTRLDGSAIACSVSDTFGNTALRALSNGVTTLADLPISFNSQTYTVKVSGSPGVDAGGYYVRFNGVAWEETVKPGSQNQIDPLTMPQRLVREADGTFTFTSIDWAERLVGDDISNPPPSFIGRSIRDTYFLRNRLGFLADENVTLSRAGNFFNFWGETALAVLDGDPVDTSTSSTKVSILNFAVAFNKDLLLFSDQSQFQLTAADILTPKTVKVDPATEFESSKHCRPVSVGQSLYFPVEKEDYTAVREYYVDSTTISNDAADVTAHVPTYLPSGVFKMASSSSEDVVVALTNKDQGALYVYKFYWSKEDKVQSAWSRFVFEPSDEILSVEFLGSVLYLVVNRADGLYLESMSLMPNQVDPGLNHEVLLDRRCSLTGVYDAGNDWTTWTLPYAEDADMKAVLGASFSGRKGALVRTTRPSSTTLRAPGDYSTGSVIVGRKYIFRYRFSEQFVKDSKEVSITGGTLKLRRMRVSYNDTGHFTVEVTPKARETYTYPFTGKVLGAASLLVGETAIETGVFPFPVLTSSSGVTIDLVNDTHLPSTFQSAEWDAEFIIKAARK